MKSPLPTTLFLTFLTISGAAQNALATPACQQYRDELERACGSNIQFFTSEDKKDLAITGIPLTSGMPALASGEVCEYPDIPGLISLHNSGATCEQFANVAGNLCFREGLLEGSDSTLTGIIGRGRCELRPTITLTEPGVQKAYLWGLGYHPSERVIYIDNVEGYIELQANPFFDFDEDAPDAIRVNSDDPRFKTLKEKLAQIRIEYLKDRHCNLMNDLIDRPLNRVSMLLSDGMDPFVEVFTTDGQLIQTGPCLTMRQFFPVFEDTVKLLIANQS